MARMLRGFFGASSNAHDPKDIFRTMRYNDLYDFYNEEDDRPATSASGDKHFHYRKTSEPFTRGDFTVYDQIIGSSRPPSASGTQVESIVETPRGPSTRVRSRTPTPQTLALWRPGSAAKSNSLSARSATPSDASRPMTAVRAAGYSSKGSKFDPLNQGPRALTPLSQRRDDGNPEMQIRELEQLVHKLVEESAVANTMGDLVTALEKAKEAGKKERLICRQREQAGLAEQTNIDLTFSVCFNLGYQYEKSGLLSEALATYSQIIKNKHFTQAGRLRVNMGNIYYQQGDYPLAIKMYRMSLDQTPNSHKETRYKIMRNIGNALMHVGEYQLFLINGFTPCNNRMRCNLLRQ